MIFCGSTTKQLLDEELVALGDKVSTDNKREIEESDRNNERRTNSIVIDSDVIAEDPDANGEVGQDANADSMDRDEDDSPTGNDAAKNAMEDNPEEEQQQDLDDRGMTDREKDAVVKELSKMKRYKLDIKEAKKNIDVEGRKLLGNVAEERGRKRKKEERKRAQIMEAAEQI